MKREALERLRALVEVAVMQPLPEEMVEELPVEWAEALSGVSAADLVRLDQELRQCASS